MTCSGIGLAYIVTANGSALAHGILPLFESVQNCAAANTTATIASAIA